MKIFISFYMIFVRLFKIALTAVFILQVATVNSYHNVAAKKVTLPLKAHLQC